MRIEHAYSDGSESVTLTASADFTAPASVALKRGELLVRFSHQGAKPLKPKRASAPRVANNGARIAADFAPTAEAVESMRVEAPAISIEHETKQFVDHWLAQSGPSSIKRDWLAAWRLWMRRAHKWAVEKGWKPTSAPSAPSGETAKARWCRERGVTVAEFDKRQAAGDQEWLDMIKRRGHIG